MSDLATPPSESAFAARLRALLPELTKSEARIGRFLLLNEAGLPLESGASLAEKTGVSEITVSRFLRRLGFQGMSALKEALLADGFEDTLAVRDRYKRIDGPLGACITREAEAILGLASQLARPEWARAIDIIETAQEVYVTGFQTVRGLAEDFARRLSIVRDCVRFVAAHDAGLAEWIPVARRDGGKRVLIMMDIVPYARETAAIARLCASLGIDLVVISDEMNNWAYDHTPHVLHAATKVGTFLESTGPLAALVNLMIHSVASCNPARTRDRIDSWPTIVRELNIY